MYEHIVNEILIMFHTSFTHSLLGLCNNFPYVVMLSAAYDVLSSLQDSEVNSNEVLSP